jgi:hypothetical protein
MTFLLVLLISWAYFLWWDQRNLTEIGGAHILRITMVAIAVWVALFAVLLLAYQSLLQEAGNRVPGGPMQDDFHRRHGCFKFFLKTVFASAYSWLCLVAIAAGVLWHVCALIGGW